MKKRAIFATVFAMLFPLSSTASTAPLLFSTIYGFGDSLTDIGNNTSEHAPLSTPPGNLWINYLAQSLGLTVGPSNNGGNDYAYAGSVTGPLPFPVATNDLTHSMLNQVQGYLTTNGGHADAHALYTVWSGANDVKDGLVYAIGNVNPDQFTAFGINLINASTNNTLSTVRILHNAGAKYIMVANLPNLGSTPAMSDINYLYNDAYQSGVYQLAYDFAIAMGHTAAQAQQIAKTTTMNAAETLQQTLTASVTSLSATYNDELLSKLNGSGIKAIQVDIEGLLQAIQANYQRFGFRSPDSSYLTPIINSDGTVSFATDSNPDEDIFYDGFHPSQMVGQIGAEVFLSEIEGPLYAGVLGVAPLGIVDNQNTNIQAELLAIQTGQENAPLQHWKVFASGLYSPNHIDSNGLSQPGYASDNTAFTVGTDYRFDTHSVIGIAVGRAIDDVNYSHNVGGFDVDDNLITVFGGYQWHDFYANTELNYGNIDYSNIKRNFMLGIVPETLTGSTTGEQYGAAATFGYNFSFLNNMLKTGPIATVDYQKITVNPYMEYSSNFELANNTAMDALQYNKQTNDSLDGGLGWQASYLTQINNLQLLPFIQATYHHQFIDANRMVSAGLTTLPGSDFEIPFTTPDSNFGLINLGVQSTFKTGLAITAGYVIEVGEPQVRSQTFMLSASLPL